MPIPGTPLWRRTVRLYTHEIWTPSSLEDRSPRGRLHALLRVISITITGLTETKSASRAAALSFSSLLGLGPLMAIAVLVAGFVLDKQDPDLAVNTLNRLIKFVAPQVTQYEQLEVNQSRNGASASPRSDIIAAASLNLQPGPSAETGGAINAPSRDATDTDRKSVV